MFQSKKPNSSRGVRHARKFRLRTDASRDTRCSRALNTQLPRVITERAIHHVIEGFHVTSLQQNLPSHAAHSGHVGSHKIWPNSLLLKLHKA